MERTSYTVADFFKIKQAIVFKDDTEIPNKTNLISMSSINWETSSFDSDLFLKIGMTDEIKEKNTELRLSKYDCLINRVGKVKVLSLLDVDYDFANNPVFASSHFMVIKPRKVIQDENLPFFHCILDVVLKNYVPKPSASKTQYITVKELENIPIYLPTQGFELLKSEYEGIYKTYQQSLRNFNHDKNMIEKFKNDFLTMNKPLDNDK
jgi:hypothetical protein